jgi:hypothetical protein
MTQDHHMDHHVAGEIGPNVHPPYVAKEESP